MSGTQVRFLKKEALTKKKKRESGLNWKYDRGLRWSGLGQVFKTRGSNIKKKRHKKAGLSLIRAVVTVSNTGLSLISAGPSKTGGGLWGDQGAAFNLVCKLCRAQNNGGGRQWCGGG